MQSPQDMLAELEDKFILGEILESDYREQKKKLVQELRDRGETIQSSGTVQLAMVRDSRNVPFCQIPGGGFYFGPNDDFKELPCSYTISKYPVTAKEFREFLANVDIGYTDEDYHTLGLVSPDDDCPACHLSFNDAKEFCRWLRRETGEYYSLPHEVEWEKAARGEDGRNYPWGNDVATVEMACFQGDVNYSCTVPVTSFETVNQSPYGCVDMVGNVWEWCLDTFEDERDPHILRGGSWCNDVDYTNCLARTFSFPPDKRVDYGGFRIIHLPGELLTEYRRAYADLGKATRVGLKVVSLKHEDKKERPSPSNKLKQLSKALDTAAAKASEGGEEVAPVETPEEIPESMMNDAMAQAISDAANMFLRKDESEATMPASKVGLSTVAGIKKDLGDLPEGVGGPKYKSIEELRQEREEAKQDAAEQSLEFDEDEVITFHKAKPVEVPLGLTYTAIIAWFLLLLAVIGAFVLRIHNF